MLLLVMCCCCCFGSTAAAAATRTLRASADELKQVTDRMCQEHYTANRDLMEHTQTFAEFIEQQKKNRSKVTCCGSLR